MKRFKLFVLSVLCVMLAATCFSFTAMASDEAPAYDVEVAAENNLATNKHDWAVDKVGTATTTFSETGMRFENFNIGGSPFAVYQTNKANEFKFSMYAKLNLTRPSEFGYDYNFDYSNLYISFCINTDTVSPVHACPWSGNKAYFSLCFENLQGHPKTLFYLNEGFVGSGADRQIVIDTDTCNWNDGNYHWFELVVTNTTREEEYRGTMQTFTGKLMQFYFDGELGLEYFQRDQKVYSNYLKDYVDYPFSNTSGYVGFWPTSDFPVGADTDTTNCYVDIAKVQMTSLDNGNTTPFVQCAAPEYDIEVKNFSPAASYEAGETIEIKLSELFSYEGEEELVYNPVCNGEKIGDIKNGYWVFTPEEAGTYLVDINVAAGSKTEVSYLTIRVEEAIVPVIPGTSSSNTEEQPSGGCGGAIGTSAIGLALLAIGAVLKRRV